MKMWVVVKMECCFTSTAQRSWGINNTALAPARKSTTQLGERMHPCSSVRKMALVLGHPELQGTQSSVFCFSAA